MVKLNFKEDFDYKSKEPKLCALGEYKNKKFLVIYVGRYPCAYVESNTDLYTEQHTAVRNNMSDCPAHCGFTWYGPLNRWSKHFKAVDPKIFNRNYIGWDYGHVGDYSRLYLDSSLELDENDPPQKWFVDDIVDCVINTIDWMSENGIN